MESQAPSGLPECQSSSRDRTHDPDREGDSEAARPRGTRPETAARSTRPWDVPSRRHARRVDDRGARSTKTNRSRHVAVGTTKSRPRSAAAPGWSRTSARSARGVAGGGPCMWRPSLRDGESKFQEFTVNPRRTPEGIRGRYRANQSTNLLRYGRPPSLATTLPRPEQAEPASMPGDYRFGLDDHERRPPLAPAS